MNTLNDSIRRASLLLGAPCDTDGYLVLKLVPEGGGCCCLHCWPGTWTAINRHIAPAGPVEDEGDVLLGGANSRFVLEGHESGPEVVLYLGLFTASVLAVKAVVELITTILKNVTEDRKHVARMRIVKKLTVGGNAQEQVVLQLDLPLSDQCAKGLECEVAKSLTERDTLALAERQAPPRLGPSVKQSGAGGLHITPAQLREHVEATGASEGNRGFACEVRPSRRGEAPLDFSIRFHSRAWSPTTKRWIGPAAIKRYLDVFNTDNDAPASAYRNVEGEGSRSASAQYLVKLLNELRATRLSR